MKLVIVESPAKAKTIERFLGPEYRVEASYGHIRDLPRTASETPKAIRDKAWGRLAVDTERGFKPFYIVPAESRKYVRALKARLARADEIVLATDEDREGESISWHLLEVLKPKVPVRRIAFHEITRPAIQAALQNPRDVDDRLVQAQEARRILDRLFGYSLSPVLWKKVRTRLSAGRVQSVALRLIVEREEERRRFHVSSFWRARATLGKGDETFGAVLTRVGDRRVATGKDFDSTTGSLLDSSRALPLDEGAATHLAEAALGAAPWRVGSVERKSSLQRPAPPFTTSTLQQAASSRLGMSPRQTMSVAQRLYEGVDLGGGDREGLITYMRTDSVTLSGKALEDAGRYIESTFGSRYYQGPRRYRTKSRVAQEAHEGIRPTEIGRTPDQVARFLDRRELRLYRLIWSRTVASQMADARLDRTTLEVVARIEGVDHTFRAVGTVVRFDGFFKVYGGPGREQVLPRLEEGDRIHAAGSAADGNDSVSGDSTASAENTLSGRPGHGVVLLSVEPEHRETKPPPRYTEAALVRELEEEGIGRPSTYTPTISTIQERDYVRKRGGHLVPTYTGMAVNQLLRSHFEKYVNLGFTARMEDALDDIARGEVQSERFLREFYEGAGDSRGLAGEIEETLPEIDYPAVAVANDPDTGEPIRVRIGRSSVYAERGEGDAAVRATIPGELLIDELTVDKLTELLKSASEAGEPIGTDPETQLPVFVRTGRYGPYVQLGDARGRDKPRWVGLPEGLDPSEVTMEFALRLLSLPRTLGTDPGTGESVKAGLGRYGPFVKRGREYRNLGSADRIFTVTLDEALTLLAQKKKSRRSATAALKELGPHPESGELIRVLDGRYGPYVTDGATNASLPRGSEPADVTMEQAVELLAGAARRRKRRRSEPWRRSVRTRR